MIENARNLAPVVLFVYSRPDHTRRTLEFLAANDLASSSDLIVYSDAARIQSDQTEVGRVRSLIKNVQGFKSVTLIERESNYGLAKNIIEGVSEICSKFGKAIVLEDDLVTSRYFLRYMNDALNKYESQKKVWHISGWNYPIVPNDIDDAFFVRIMNCWGWGTWHDRWQHFTKNTDQLIASFDRRMIREFDVDDSGVFWSQVLSNKNGTINTWAIYWYATIFINSGLCLNPAVSYVDNIGLDGSGTHGCRDSEIYENQLNKRPCLDFPDSIEESHIGIGRIKEFYENSKPTICRRIKGKLLSVLRRVKR